MQVEGTDALRHWVAAARAELNRIVPSTDVIRNVMNQDSQLHAVSGRLLEAAERLSNGTPSTAHGAHDRLGTAMKHLGEAKRLWGSVTTAMPPIHEYVTAARELHVALTDATMTVPTSSIGAGSRVVIDDNNPDPDSGNEFGGVRHCAQDR